MAISVIPDPGVISFSRGVPSPDMFPVEQLADCARAAVLEHGRTALNYGAPGGYEPLREWIAARHGVTADRILVTPGSLIGLNLVVRDRVRRHGRRSSRRRRTTGCCTRCPTPARRW